MTSSNGRLVLISIGEDYWVRLDAIEAVYSDGGQETWGGDPRVRVVTAAREYVAGPDVTLRGVIDRMLEGASLADVG